MLNPSEGIAYIWPRGVPTTVVPLFMQYAVLRAALQAIAAGARAALR